MRNEKGRAEGEPSVRVPCVVCGREPCAWQRGLYSSEIGAMAEQRRCYQVGYERRGLEIEVVRAENRALQLALDRTAGRKPPRRRCRDCGQLWTSPHLPLVDISSKWILQRRRPLNPFLKGSQNE